MVLYKTHFAKVDSLTAIGILGTACAPTAGTNALVGEKASSQIAGTQRSSLTPTIKTTAEPKEGTAFYPTRVDSLGKTRATLVPPKQSAPEFRMATANSDVNTAANGSRTKLQTGSKPTRGYQTGRSLSEERDGFDGFDRSDSFDGVDVASVSDSGSADTSSGGGGGATTASHPGSDFGG